MQKKTEPKEGRLGPFEFTRVPGTHNWSVQIPEKFNGFFRRPVTRTGGGCRIDSGPRVIHDLYKTAQKLAKDLEACDQLDLGDPIYGLEIAKSEVGIVIIDGPALTAYRALSGVRSTSVPQENPSTSSLKNTRPRPLGYAPWSRKSVRVRRNRFLRSPVSGLSAFRPVI